jgi:hypothetical protein
MATWPVPAGGKWQQVWRGQVGVKYGMQRASKSIKLTCTGVSREGRISSSSLRARAVATTMRVLRTVLQMDPMYRLYRTEAMPALYT